jgi:hypothetical protein
MEDVEARGSQRCSHGVNTGNTGSTSKKTPT